MKRLLLFFILFLPLFAFSQTKNRGSVDLDLGIYFVRVQNAPIDPPQVMVYTPNERSYGDFYGSLSVYRSIAHIRPDISAGLFIKPGLSTNLRKHSFQSNEWMVLQFPCCAAISIGRSDSVSPGFMFGGGMEWNYYGVSSTGIPDFHGWEPYFFWQVHRGNLGFRFAVSAPQTYSNKDATITKTHAEFTIGLLATLPY